MVPVLPTLLLLLASYATIGGHAEGRHGDVILSASTSSSSLNKPRVVCSGPRALPSTNRTWLPLYHRRSPCSPLFHSAEPMESMADKLRRDQTRANGILKRNLSKSNGTSSSPSAASSVPTMLGLPLDTLEYVVTVRLGTPAVTQTLEIDTGSSLSWVQCRPCPARRCQRQKDPFFDPARSSTYSPFACGSSECAQLRRERYGGCSSCSAVCQYVVEYADGSNTTGTYGSDALTLTPSSSDAVLLRKFRFGCSHARQGTSGRADGVLALGGGAQSLVSQVVGKKAAFSYCLPPTPERTGFLSLGAPPRRGAASRYVVTPMHRSRQDPTFYSVLLRGIAVAGRHLDVPASVFAGGSVVDSGTIVTRLPPTAYRALRAAFRREMRMYPRAGRNSILDTCYNLTAVVRLPRVALVFERGATVELHPSGVMVQDCLAFAPTAEDGSPGIIGNVQQRTFEVLYDVGGGAVGFRRGMC